MIIKCKRISLMIISLFLLAMILTGLNDFFHTKDIIDIFILIIFLLLLYLCIKSLLRKNVKNSEEKFTQEVVCEPLLISEKIEEKSTQKVVCEPLLIPGKSQEEKNQDLFKEKEKKTSEINTQKIIKELERADFLYKMIQETDDKKLFFLSLNEVCQILYSLIPYENIIKFHTLPSEQLKLINLKRNDLINDLEKRIQISNLDLDKYAKECNEYVTMKENLDFDNMNGHDFEYFCSDLLKNNGFINVEVTQGSGDHGIDIIAEKDGISYAIQCKCYSKDIGNSAVQQAHTGKSIYKKDIAVVLTNRYFTNQAKEEAKILGVKLWDRSKLLSLIENKIQ